MKAVKRPTKTGKRRVKFQIKADPGSEVFVAGSFNGWDPARNRLKFKDGVFSTALLLPQGRYEYKFVVDQMWCVDPECREWEPNGLGSLNSVISVG
jgi:1,4-alpha-glucan branching enzyme